MSFHAYRINELYSSTDGKVQFIELNVGSSNGESFWQGVSISSASNGTTHIFTFPNNLPSTATSNTSVLIATQGFVDLGIMSPDFIVPAGFLFPAGGTLNFGGVDVVTYAQLPLNGTLSVNRVGELNRPGFRGGRLVKVKPGFRSSRQVAESSLPQPRPVEYTQSAPAVGGG